MCREPVDAFHAYGWVGGRKGREDRGIVAKGQAGFYMHMVGLVGGREGRIGV